MLNQSNEWRQLRDVLPDDIIIVDVHGIIGYVSDAVAALAGYATDELVGTSIERLVPDEQREAHVAHRARYQESPTPRFMRDHHHQLRHRDGRTFPVGIALSPLRVEGRDMVVAAVSIIDASLAPPTPERALKMAAAASLAEREADYRAAFEHTMAPMYFTDHDDVITVANEAFARLVGISRLELVGRSARAFTHPDDLDLTEHVRDQLISGELDAVHFAKRYVHATGRIVEVDVTASTVRASDGSVRRFIVSVLDTTERRRRERSTALLSHVRRLAIVATDESELLGQFCQLLVDLGGFRIVSYGSTTETRVVAPLTATDQWPAPRDGPGAEAITSGSAVLYGSSEHGSPAWHDYAERLGLRSAAAVALRVRGTAFAVSVFHDRPDGIDVAILLDLEEVVHELELGLAHVSAVTETRDALDAARDAYDALTRAESALAESERRFRLAFSENMAPMVFVGLDDILLDVNDAFVEMVGRSRDELVGRDSAWFTHPDDRTTTEDARQRLVTGEVEQIKYTKRFIHRTGRTVVVEILKTPVRDDDGRIMYFIASDRDITEERQLSEQLLHRALHDPLTGLANRALFEDRLGQARERLLRNGGYGAVLLIDLDDFKGVNDTYGHHVGDQLLVGVARRFELVSRSIDTLGRVGGDEFLYLAEGLTDSDEAATIADRLLRVLDEPFSLDGLTIEQHATIGVALYNDGSLDGAECIKRADTAMYEAKRNRRGHYEIFQPAMLASAVHRFTLAQSLSRALRASEVAMHFQPIIALPTYQVVGFEALMRWNSSREGSIPPSVFLPIAEQSDLIYSLEDFAIREAVRAAASWGVDGSYGDQCYVTINLSAAQFRSPKLVPLVADALTEVGLAPSRLVLEISEAVASADLAETIMIIERLRAIGVGTALDDFGTGHASLARLAELHPQMVKIDQSFVHTLGGRPNHDVVLDAVFALGQDLGVTMLAEGVETTEQLAQLRALGCQLVQGFLLSPPVPEDEVFAQLATRPRERLSRITTISQN